MVWLKETKNISIEEPMKEMVHDYDAPMFLWGKEARRIVYILNRSPHRFLEGKTPEEVFIGQKNILII